MLVRRAANGFDGERHTLLGTVTLIQSLTSFANGFDGERHTLLGTVTLIQSLTSFANGFDGERHTLLGSLHSFNHSLHLQMASMVTGAHN